MSIPSVMQDENGKLSSTRLIGLILSLVLGLMAVSEIFGADPSDIAYEKVTAVLLALAANWGIRGTVKNMKAP